MRKNHLLSSLVALSFALVSFAATAAPMPAATASGATSSHIIPIGSAPGVMTMTNTDTSSSAINFAFGPNSEVYKCPNGVPMCYCYPNPNIPC